MKDKYFIAFKILSELIFSILLYQNRHSNSFLRTISFGRAPRIHFTIHKLWGTFYKIIVLFSFYIFFNLLEFILV
jgi:hypothetical protein